MSSTNKTTNLKMHSWVRTDPVVCEDFNENFSKLDEAVGELRATRGCCEIYTGSYTGTGTQVHSLTFPKAPVFLMVKKSEKTIYLYYGGFVSDGQWFKGQSSNSAQMAVSGGTVTITQRNADDYVININGQVYEYIAFAPASA